MFNFYQSQVKSHEGLTSIRVRVYDKVNRVFFSPCVFLTRLTGCIVSPGLFSTECVALFYKRLLQNVQNVEFRILAVQNVEFRILAVQNVEFRILAVQNLESKVLAVQNLEFRILADANSNSKS